MTPDEIGQIMGLKVSDSFPVSLEETVEIVSRWNDGYSAPHIQELMEYADLTMVTRPLAVVRQRTKVPMRRVGNGPLPVEHPSWWTPARLEQARSLYETADMKNRDIAKRLGCSEASVSFQARAAGWARTRIVAAKAPSPRGGIRPVDRAIAAGVAKQRGVVWEALADTTPKPFWQVAIAGECNWILGDTPGSMADALCCAAPTEPGQKYCPEHTKLGINPLAWGKPRTSKQLERSLVRYA